MEKGRALIELMLVVVIIGILASLAIPRILAGGVRAKQPEAGGILKQIYTASDNWEMDHQGNLSAVLADVIVE